MIAQWLEQKLATLSALDSSQISEPNNNPTTNICQKKKKKKKGSEIVVFGAAGCRGNIELSLPGIFPPDESPATKNPKGIGQTNPSINFSL